MVNRLFSKLFPGQTKKELEKSVGRFLGTPTAFPTSTGGAVQLLPTREEERVEEQRAKDKLPKAPKQELNLRRKEREELATSRARAAGLQDPTFTGRDFKS